MIRVHVFRHGRELTDVPVAELSEVHAEPGTLVWVDAASPSAAELAAVGEELSVHPLAMKAWGRRRQRPKVEEYGDHALLVAYGVAPPGAGRPGGLHEVDLVVGAGYLLTVHPDGAVDAAATSRRVNAHPRLHRHGSGFLLYVVLDELVDTFFEALDPRAERVEGLEDAMFSGRSQEVQAEIFRLRKDLGALRRVAGPLREAVLALLRPDLDLFDGEARRYLRDVHGRLAHVVDSIGGYQELADGALGASQVMASNRVNEVARTLAAYASIFAAVTVITGVYGMNFEHMPELDWWLGYPFALGLMLLAAVGLLAYFKRKGWL